MTPGDFSTLFHFPSIKDLCLETDTNIYFWNYLTQKNRLSIRSYKILEFLEKRNMELYENAEKEAEKEYFERKLFLEKIRYGRKESNKRNDKIEWNNIENLTPEHNNLCYVYADENVYSMYYFKTEPKEIKNIIFSGEGFYDFNYKTKCFEKVIYEYWSKL